MSVCVCSSLPVCLTCKALKSHLTKEEKFCKGDSEKGEDLCWLRNGGTEFATGFTTSRWVTLTQFPYLENEDNDRLPSQLGSFLHASQAKGSNGGRTDIIPHPDPQGAYIQGKADTMTGDNIMMLEGLRMVERWTMGQVQAGREWAMVKFCPRSKELLLC